MDDGGKKKKKRRKTQKLKPKQQWDRYGNMKKQSGIRVAVRVLDGDSSSDWLEVGRVKSKDEITTEMAVVRQKVIIAEVRVCSGHHC